MKTALTALASAFGYTVQCAEYGGAHRCFSKREALEWMACYPVQCRVTVLRQGRLVAERH